MNVESEGIGLMNNGSLTELYTNVESPTVEDIQEALRHIKNGKVSGIVQIPGELLRANLKCNSHCYYHYYSM